MLRYYIFTGFIVACVYEVTCDELLYRIAEKVKLPTVVKTIISILLLMALCYITDMLLEDKYACVTKEFISATGIISFAVFLAAFIIGIVVGDDRAKKFSDTICGLVVGTVSLWWIIAWVIIQTWEVVIWQ